jgi:hypothetical protein
MGLGSLIDEALPTARFDELPEAHRTDVVGDDAQARELIVA